MDIIKKLFSFNKDDDSAIGLCKFNDNFYKKIDNKERFKKRINEDINLSEILKKPI
ncbi:hypothetical protein IJX73_02625 [bacterium]|nr:hypothetical protein [bacterium]MBQ9149804.1 hypothetical protein [bacterium]